MVSFLPHLLVPGLLALAFLRRLPRKWVILCAPIAWLPDLDYVSNMMGLPGHRVLTHNVWFPLLFLGLSWWAWRRKQDGKPFAESVTEPGWALGWLLAAYYWASHVLLDLFAGGALLFWPLSTLNFFLLYEIRIDLQSGDVTPVAEAGTEEGPPELSQDYAWLNYEHTATLAFIVLFALASLAWWAWRRRTRPGQRPQAGADRSTAGLAGAASGDGGEAAGDSTAAQRQSPAPSKKGK